MSHMKETTMRKWVKRTELWADSRKYWTQWEIDRAERRAAEISERLGWGRDNNAYSESGDD